MKMTKRPSREAPELTVSASEFKAHCLSIFDRLAKRKLRRVIVTKRGVPVAELVPPSRELPSLWGCMKGTVTIPEGVDLTQPVVDEPLDAELGILHR